MLPFVLIPIDERSEKMKRVFFMLTGFCLLVLLGGCGPSAEQISTMTASAWTPTSPPTNTPAPTNTPLPTDTPAPTALSPFLFRDDFDGQLADGWVWLGEDPAKWSLTDASGFVRIVAQIASIGAEGEPRNFLVRAVPDGNYEIETFVNFEPTTNFQFAGLLAYDAQGKALQFGRAFAQCNVPFCVGNGLYFDNAIQQGMPNFATTVSDPSKIYLRLRREDKIYTAFYSEDGSTWTQVGQHNVDIPLSFIGLIASQAYEEEKPADFDYFSIRAIP